MDRGIHDRRTGANLDLDRGSGARSTILKANPTNVALDQQKKPKMTKTSEKLARTGLCRKGWSKEIRFTVVEPVGTVPRRVRRTNGRKMVVCSTKRSGNGPHGL